MGTWNHRVALARNLVNRYDYKTNFPHESKHFDELKWPILKKPHLPPPRPPRSSRLPRPRRPPKPSRRPRRKPTAVPTAMPRTVTPRTDTKMVTLKTDTQMAMPRMATPKTDTQMAMSRTVIPKTDTRTVRPRTARPKKKKTKKPLSAKLRRPPPILNPFLSVPKRLPSWRNPQRRQKRPKLPKIISPNKNQLYVQSTSSIKHFLLSPHFLT